MADNVPITAGAGTSIATDDVGGVQYQRVKLAHGADGSATDVSTASPLPVTLADGGSVTLGAKADAKSTATDTTAITAMSVWKQISASIQAAAASLAGTVTVAAHAVTQSGTWTVQPGNTANTTAWKVDGSAVTQPVSAASLPLPSGASTAAKQAALGTAGSASSDVLTVQGAASMTKLLVTPDLPSGASTAAKQAALGTAGAASSDVLSVQGVASMTPLLVTPAANSAVNVAQINGVTALMGNGATGTGSHRVTIANDSSAIAGKGEGATGAAVPSGARYTGVNALTALPTAATAGNLTGLSADKYGRLVALLGTIRDLRVTQTTTISASTSETTIGTAVASTFLDLILLVISNTSTATNTRIDFRDTTAGSVLFSLQSNGGQPPIGFSVPGGIPQTSVNTNWTAQCATSTTDVRVYLVAEKNK